MPKANAPPWAAPVWRCDWIATLMRDRRFYASQRALGAYVLTRAFAAKGGCDDSQESIQQALGLKERFTRDTLKKLEGAGYLRCTRRKRASNLYEPLMPKSGNVLPDLGAQGRQPTAGQDSPNRQPTAGGYRQPTAGDSQLGTLSDDPVESEQHHHPREADWPQASDADLADYLATLLFASERQREKFVSTAHVLASLRKLRVSWLAVQWAALVAWERAVRGEPAKEVETLRYFVREATAAQASGQPYTEGLGSLRTCLATTLGVAPRPYPVAPGAALEPAA